MLPKQLENPPAPPGSENCCASHHHARAWVGVVLATLAAPLTLQILLFQDEEDRTPHLLFPPPPNWGFWDVFSL